MTDFNSLTASQLGDMIGQGKIDPVELTEHFLIQIESSPIGRKIYSTVTFKLALEQAKDSKMRADTGRRLSSLDGVPISWKDLFDISGYPCEAGSQLLAGRLAIENAKVYNFAEAHGLICLGKTHMSELAFSGLGLNPIRETPTMRELSRICSWWIFIRCGNVSLIRLGRGRDRFRYRGFSTYTSSLE